MKKYVVTSIIVLAVLILLPRFVTVSAIYVEGQAPDGESNEQLMKATGLVSDETTTRVVEIKKSNYTLPYPGILPDHPLYWLKGIRDKILDTLIADPTRQAEFDILQSDKRLAMGQALLDKGNPSLAEETMSKGANYMDSAVTAYTKSLATDKPMPGYIKERLIKSLEKHVELTTDLAVKDTNLVGIRDRLTTLLSQMQPKLNK